MMKKVLSLLVLCLAMSLSTASHAGTFMAGAKVWYGFWDSAIGTYGAEYADRTLESFFLDSYDPEYGAVYWFDFRADTKTGKGVLAGPMLSYQTDDGRWTISFAWMDGVWFFFTRV